MARRGVTLLTVALFLAACGKPTTPPKPPALVGARVVSSGFSVRNGVLGVAALIRNRTKSELRDIRLAVNFLNGRNNFASATATLAFCPASSDCWWGQAYTQGELLKDPKKAKTVNIVVSRIGSSGGDAKVVSARVSTTSGRTRVTAPKGDGTVYVVWTKNGKPTYGWSLPTGSLRDLSGPKGAERVHAYFYPS